MNTEHVSFSSSDHLTLPGLLYTPARASKRVAVWLHGMGDSGVFYSPKRITALATGLTEQGIALLAFNNRGAHNSKLLYKDNPDICRAPAFVRKDTYKAVKIALLNDESGLDYSDLVEELLTAWLTNKR